MLPQVALEAAYSATYVENYLDCVENLPDDLQRLMSRMRELDVTYRAYLRDVETQTEWLGANDVEHAGRKARAISRIQQALIAAQELGDEKLNVVQNLLDLIENKTRQLDVDYKHLGRYSTTWITPNAPSDCLLLLKDYRKEEPVPEVKEQQAVSIVSNVSGGGGGVGGAANSGERQSKRARRTRHDTFTGLDSNVNEPTPPTEHVLRSSVTPAVATTNTQKKATGAGKKKKRKSKGTAQVAQREDSPPREEEPAIDPDEPTYCLCDQISYGEMIMCDNDLCPIEWFHFSCVSLTTKPKGKWFCPKCRGDRPNVMKPKAQFLRELERYNKEKEEKT